MTARTWYDDDEGRSVTEPSGFVHAPYEEWVGHPIKACSCGEPWPCSFVRTFEELRGEQP